MISIIKNLNIEHYLAILYNLNRLDSNPDYFYELSLYNDKGDYYVVKDSNISKVLVLGN